MNSCIFLCSSNKASFRANLTSDTLFGPLKDTQPKGSLLDTRDITSLSNPIIVFNETINVESWDSTKIKHLFSLMKKNINALRVETTGEILCSDFNFNSDCVYRHEIGSFLSLIKSVMVIQKCTDAELLSTIVMEIQNLFGFLGQVSNISSSFPIRGSTQRDGYYFYHLFHIHLDVYGFVLEILNYCHTKEMNYLCDGFQRLGQSELMLDILLDLLSISAQKYFKVSSVNLRSCLKPFPCDCVRQLFCLLKNTSETDTSITTLHPFWVLINKVVDIIINGLPEDSDLTDKEFILINLVLDTAAEERHLFAAWLVAGLTDIFQETNVNSGYAIDMFSQGKVARFDTNNVSTMVKLVNYLLRQENNLKSRKKQTLTALISYCITGLNTWTPSMDLVLPFLEFYTKSINDIGLDFENSLPTTSFLWKEQIKHLTSKRISVHGDDDFQCFVCLCHVALTRLLARDDLKKYAQFQKLKSRFSLKMQAKKLEELTDPGFYCLLTLLLSIAFSADSLWPEVIDKLYSSIPLLLDNQANHSKLALTQRFLFTLFHLIPPNSNVESLVTPVTSIFTKYCQNLPSWDPSKLQTTTKYNIIIDFLLAYSTEVKILFESRAEELKLEGLICPAFKVLITRMSSRELPLLVNLVHRLILESRKQLEVDIRNENVIGFASACFTQFLPFVQTQFQQSANLSNLSKAAANFTVVSYLMSKDCSKSDIVQEPLVLFTNFALNKRVNAKYACEYLALVVEEPDLIFMLQQSSGNTWKSAMIALWFRLGVSLPHPQQNFQVFSDYMSSLLEIPQKMDAHSDLSQLISFLEHLNNQYVSSSLQERSKLKMEAETYFRDSIDVCDSLLKDSKTDNVLIQNGYEIISALVQYCAVMLYTAGRTECLLPRILDTFYNKSRIQSLSSHNRILVQIAIEKSVAQVLSGMAKFGDSIDNFLQRKISQLHSLQFDRRRVQ